MKTKVIYHGNCADGFTAAWVAWLEFGASADYIAAKYGDAPPDVAGCDVLIVDFSYPRAVLLEMQAKAASIRVLDHHKSAAADLEGLDFCTFDMGRSGAGLTWDTLFAGRPRPELVSYVEDRDLWRFLRPYSKEINAWIGVQEQTFDAWESLSVDLHSDFADVLARGEALLLATRRYVDATAREARTVEILGHSVPVVNAPYVHASELVGFLAEQEGVPFAVAWFQRGDGRFQYSLRSKHGFDVSEIARRHGGGGHAAAAGFTTDARISEVARG